MSISTQEIPPTVYDALQKLHACVPASKLRRTLRSLLLEYMALKSDPYPAELEDLPEEFICLFRFLDAMEAMEKVEKFKPVHHPVINNMP